MLSRHGGKQGRSGRDTVEKALEAREGGGQGQGQGEPGPPSRLSGWGTSRRELGPWVTVCPRAGHLAAPWGLSLPFPLQSRPSGPWLLWESPTLGAFGHLS